MVSVRRNSTVFRNDIFNSRIVNKINQFENPMLTRFLDPKNDLAFKKIFGTEKHKDILMHFLNDVLNPRDGIHILEVEFLNPIQDPEVLAKKQSIVDVLCKDQNGRQYIIEMQVAKAHGFESRAQYYATKAYCSQMNKGGKYADLKEVIFIAILDYEIFPKKPHYKSNHTIRDDLTNERDLDGLRFVFIELPRFNKKLTELSNMLEKWCYFFKYAQETTSQELVQLTKNEPIMEKAYEVLDRYAWNDQELLRYDQATKSEMDAAALLTQSRIDGRTEGEKIGIEKGEKIGIKKGVAQNKLEIAKQMKQEGIASALIKKITGIDI